MVGILYGVDEGGDVVVCRDSPFKSELGGADVVIVVYVALDGRFCIGSPGGIWDGSIAGLGYCVDPSLGGRYGQLSMNPVWPCA